MRVSYCMSEKNKIQRMKNIRVIFITLLSFFFSTGTWAQDTYNLNGKVLSYLNEPIEGAVITLQDATQATSGEDGTFSFKASSVKPMSFTVWYPGYLQEQGQVNGRQEIIIKMTPDNEYKYNRSVILPLRESGVAPADYTTATNMSKKDFILGRPTIDRQLSGQVSGLQIKRNSGMPGEGSYYNLRGIRSLVGDNAPLVVINGVPYLPDKNESRLITGYSRNIFQAYNLQDIENITVLKGAEASLYGSMGSNGVILIETENAASNDLETRVSYYGQFGAVWNKKRMPLLSGSEYTSYLSDVGLTMYSDMSSFYNNFPFLKDPNNPRYNYLYNNNTDWQEYIYRNGFVTDQLIRIEGGDEIAKYDLSLGYASEDGILESTSMQRYHAQLSTNVMVSTKVNIFSTILFAYMNGTLQEQGMNRATNPILAAYARSPLLSPYEKDREGNVLSTYSTYYYGLSTEMAAAVSNPLAIVNRIDTRTRRYDLNMKAGISYTPIRNLVLTGTFGLYYDYDNQLLFIPGKTNEAIVPVNDVYGKAENFVKSGVAEATNFFMNLNGRYNMSIDNIHKFNFMAGTQATITHSEFDAGEGRNTANDFYQTLGNTQALGRRFFGYTNKWNWMNIYGHADYTYNNMVQGAINMSLDGASSIGSDANRFSFYPSVSAAWLGKGWKFFQDATWLDKFNIRAEYGLTGNSRYASTLSKYYYVSVPYDAISTIAWSNVPNTNLKPEKVASLNLGMDLDVLDNRLRISFNYFNNQISDLISAQPVSSVYGSSPYYANIGDMENKGVELSAYVSLVRTHNFEWIVGGNIACNTNKIKSLGGIDQVIHDGTDNLQLVTKVGESPYQFYGYKSAGVFSTQAEADAANLINDKGVAFGAGDVHFADQNNDGRIDKEDRVALGSSAPDFFGGFSSQIRYKSFVLSAEFIYSKGNMGYNAVRRELESMSTLANQDKAVVNRWIVEGQITDMPRASYGDPLGNSSFSDRWIEDASYVRMKDITFSYSFDKTMFKFFRSGTFYVTGENLVTFTNYLGLDPEFSYSYNEDVQGCDYAKVMQPKSVKFGINLKF